MSLYDMQAKNEKTKELCKKYKDTGADPQKLATSIKVSSEFEYKNSSTLGWGGVYMVDRFQSMLTGYAITNNTQKLLDAQTLEEQANTAPSKK